MAEFEKDHGTASAPQRRERPLRGDLVRIGRKLGQRYGAVAEEALPDRFAELLERLDHRERGSGRGD